MSLMMINIHVYRIKTDFVLYYNVNDSVQNIACFDVPLIYFKIVLMDNSAV